jgi:hypothetical protein
MAATTDGLAPFFRERVEAFLADPESRAMGIFLRSAWRSREEQERLYATLGPGLAAKPGTSNHERGIAIDVGIPGIVAIDGRWPATVRARVDATAARHGLHSPLAWEDWHFEPLPNWQPPPRHEEDDVAFVDVTVKLSTKTGRGEAVVVGVGMDRALSATVLTNTEGWTYKVALKKTGVLGGAVVVVDAGGPILAPITVTVRVAHRR